MKNKVINTSLEPKPQWLFGRNPNAIEEQERRGQEQLTESEILPVEVNYGNRKTLEDAGVIFGKPIKNDPIFCEVQLPNGWKIEPTDHSMWSELKDLNGKVRASIFYKAAFYDRHAHLNIESSEH